MVEMSKKRKTMVRKLMIIKNNVPYTIEEKASNSRNFGHNKMSKNGIREKYNFLAVYMGRNCHGVSMTPESYVAISYSSTNLSKK